MENDVFNPKLESRNPPATIERARAAEHEFMSHQPPTTANAGG